MNPLKKGQELKMPDVKVPAVLEDLFYDLRDRRLLPLVALVVVAIVAVPFLLGDSPSRSPGPPVTATGSAVPSGAKISHFVVAEADPGLRVPRKRLAKRPEKDPFVQKFVAPVANSGAASQTPETTTTTVTDTTTTTGPTPSSGSSPSVGSPPSTSPGGAGGAGSEPGQLVAYTYAIDVKITRIETALDGSTQKGEPETRKRVVPPAVLPGEKAQVVTYMGLSPKTGKPLFLVSTDVTGVFGEGKCVSGTETCQLLEMEANREFPETFVYGENGVRYKIAVLRVEAVRVSASESSQE